MQLILSILAWFAAGLFATATKATEDDAPSIPKQAEKLARDIREAVRSAATTLTEQARGIAGQLQELRVLFLQSGHGLAAIRGTADGYRKYVAAHITVPLEADGVNVDSVMELANRHIRANRVEWFGQLAKAETLSTEQYKELMAGELKRLAPVMSSDEKTVTDENKAERDKLAATLEAAKVMTTAETAKASKARKAASRSKSAELRDAVRKATPSDGPDVELLLGSARQHLDMVLGILGSDAASKLAKGTIDRVVEQLKQVSTRTASATRKAKAIQAARTKATKAKAA